MTKAKSHLPDGIRTVTPFLMLKSCIESIEWYRRVFGAEVRTIAPGPSPGSTMHAEIRIGDSSVYLADDMPMSSVKSPALLGGPSASITLYFPDCDAVYKRAVAAGATVQMPMDDMFWGDRYGVIKDPFGCVWAIATHKEDLTPEEMNARTREFFAKAAQQGS